MECKATTIRDIISHAREARPAECCGLLVGRAHQIIEAVPIRNLAAESTTRYFLDPKEHIDARRAARRQGLEIIGFYHSHPNTTAEPSPTDLAEATYREHVYLIVGLRTNGVDDVAEARLFRLGDTEFVEVPLVLT